MSHPITAAMICGGLATAILLGPPNGFGVWDLLQAACMACYGFLEGASCRWRLAICEGGIVRNGTIFFPWERIESYSWATDCDSPTLVLRFRKPYPPNMAALRRKVPVRDRDELDRLLANKLAKNTPI